MKLRCPDAARAYFDRALSITETAFGSNSGPSGYILLHYAVVLRALRQPDRATLMAAEARSILQRSNQKRTVDIRELANFQW